MRKEENIEFPLGRVPTDVVAKVYGKSETWVRVGIVAGWLPLGFATRKGELVTDVAEMNSRKGRIDYYISPKKLYEETGYLWEGKSHEEKNCEKN